MEKRKAYDLREVLIVYNFALVLLSAWMVHELARAVYIYWPSKFVESLQTVFFVLRKKNNRVSFLHVYHHTTMFFLGWTGAKWLPGGITFFGGACNSFVHVVVHAHYGLSAIGPQIRPYLWWKRCITKIQLIQFLILLIYMINALRISCFGGFHQTMTLYFTAAFTVALAFLFGNFYIQAYLKKNEASPNDIKKSKPLMGAAVYGPPC